jgi:hypothetical protein
VSLIVTVDDPNAPQEASDRHFMECAGFECYRRELWGTEAVASRAPMLAEIATDLHVSPGEFEAFEAQCRKVDAEADAIARELRWRNRGAETIRMYIRNFLQAVEFARSRGSERISIW